MRSLVVTLATAICVAMVAPAAAAPWVASLSGTVVDIKTLQPVPDATIKVFENSGSQVMGQATSDARGAFLITGLKGGYYRMQFSKSGFQRTIITGVFMRPNERMIEAAPIAMYPNGVPLPNLAMAKPC